MATNMDTHEDQTVNKLQELVKLARRYRADKYDLNELSFMQRKLVGDIEVLNTEIQYAKAGFRVHFKELGTLGELQDHLQQLSDDTSTCREQSDDIKDDVDKVCNQIRKDMDALYTDPGLRVLSLMRVSCPAPFKLSPSFWQQLRNAQSKLTSTRHIVDQTESVCAIAEAESVETRQIIRAVKSNITDLESNRSSGTRPIRRALLRLSKSMRRCQAFTEFWQKLRAEMTERQQQQWAAEVSLLLKYVAPVLESEQLLEPDNFRSSIIDLAAGSVEPLIFPDPPLELDDDTSEELDRDHARAVRQVLAYEALLHHADSNYTKDLWAYLLAHPRRTRADFRRKHLAFKETIGHRLREAQHLQREVIQRGKKYNKWASDYDFFQDKHDKKHAVPLTAAQLAAKAHKIKQRWNPSRLDSIEQWIQGQLKNSDSAIAPLPSGDLAKIYESRTSVSPISVDRDTADSLDEDSQELRNRLQAKHEEECEAMREGLQLSQSSEISARCCC